MDPDTAKVVALFISTAIKDVGFPIFVAVYLLVRVDPAIRALTAAIHSLSDVQQAAAGFTRRTADPRQ
jgi:hypothetical protein